MERKEDVNKTTHLLIMLIMVIMHVLVPFLTACPLGGCWQEECHGMIPEQLEEGNCRIPVSLRECQTIQQKGCIIVSSTCSNRPRWSVAVVCACTCVLACRLGVEFEVRQKKNIRVASTMPRSSHPSPVPFN
jgi:hypothetical protein